MNKRLRKAFSYMPTYVVWSLATIFTVIPIWWLIVVSARSRVELFNAPTLLIKSFYVQNYTNVLTDRVFQGYMLNSLIISTANALLVTVLALLATYALSRYKLQGSDNIFFWTITNRMAPPAAFLLPLFIIFTQLSKFNIGGVELKLYDTHIGLILLYCVFNLPFAIWLMKGIMDGIPIELDEAAFVDGATTFQVLRKIIVPTAAPGLAVTAILSWVFAWNEYLFAATLTSFRARTITTGLAEFVTVTGTNWGEMAAVATLTLIPSLIFVTIAQRYIVMGLTFGAVKE
ncbi:MAG: carbohydrate ABC transporter permease [Anaerolineae bacterium]|nr:carbohydrate ABC transporter permease [Anaerolineae bacterium]